MQDSEDLGTGGLRGPHVSVIIPVRNAADTLAETLSSLASQTYSDFEVIVVDDGSSDGTAGIVQEWMERDPRIRTLPQPPSGVSVARNSGLLIARGEWILFLDGDDWLAPAFFARMIEAAGEHPQADVVYCGYRRVPPDGAVLPAVFDPQLEANPLKVLAVTCAVCIHSVLIRRTLLMEAGGFDTQLKTSEDWDLWIRLARMGAEFVAVPEVMALYRIRPGSASSKALQMARDYQIVVRRAHGPDPRVRNGPQRYRQGWQGNNVEELCVYNATYLAAIEAAVGGDGAAVFDTLTSPPDCAQIVSYLCHSIVDGLTLGAGLVPEAIADETEARVRNIAQRIEAISSGPSAADRIMRETACLLLNAQDLSQPKTLWGIHSRQLDLGSPIGEFTIPEGVHHLLLRLRFKGRAIEDYYLPVHGAMDSRELAETILTAIGFKGPMTSRRLHRALALVPHFSAMTLRSAWTIWRSKRQRQRKLVALARNLYGTFWICARLYLSARGPAPRGLIHGEAARAQIERCRADVFGSTEPAFGVDALTPPGRTSVLRRAFEPSPSQIPVLMYHRIALDGPAALAQWRLSPAMFEQQLKFLRREGFTTITSHELWAAMQGERTLPPRSVMLTFDDAYCDFYDTAYPLLRHYGAAAELFVVTGKVGESADWDKEHGPPAPLMGWNEVTELSRNGIVIGSHMVSHRHATGLNDFDLVEEGAISRFVLESYLGMPVTSLALPFGDYDRRAIEAMALCGYRCVYTCDSAPAATDGDPFRIPRLEVMGNTDPSSFARMLGLTPQEEAMFA